MLVVFRAPGEQPVCMEVAASLEAHQKLVGGLLERVPFGPDGEFDLWCNEEGLLEGLEPNLYFAPDQIIVGPIFICRGDDEGNSVGLTETEANLVMAMLKPHLLPHRQAARWQ